MLMITLIAFFAVKASLDAAHHADRAAAEAQVAVSQVQQGRHIGQGITCAVLSAVGQEGQQVIAGSASGLGSGPFTRFLEAHGYPPLSVREKAARIAGEQYVRGISRRVHAQVGSKGDGLIRADGTIDCARLERLSNIPSGSR
jgi:hypothetical protein